VLKINDLQDILTYPLEPCCLFRVEKKGDIVALCFVRLSYLYENKRPAISMKGIGLKTP
jgi:hypothetical protein